MCKNPVGEGASGYESCYNSIAATLGEVGYYSRRIVKWGIISVIIMLIPFVFRIIKSIYLTLAASCSPSPYRQLWQTPTSQFLNWLIRLINPNFVETIEGKLPSLSNVGQVYFVETSRSRILSLDKSNLRLITWALTVNPSLGRTDLQVYSPQRS